MLAPCKCIYDQKKKNCELSEMQKPKNYFRATEQICFVVLLQANPHMAAF